MSGSVDMEGGALMKRAMSPSWHIMELGFRATMATEMRRVCPDLSDPMGMATDTLREFLDAEGIGFGHPDYAWDHAAAVIVAREYQTDLWERNQ